MVHIRYFFLFMLLYTMSGSLSAYTFVPVPSTQSLTVRTVAQDEVGRIWFAAGKALMTYDGYDVDIYSSDELSEAGAINCCLICKDGKILLGGERGLVAFDTTSNTFSFDEMLARCQVRCMETSGGDLWIGTNKGLYFHHALVGGLTTDIYALCVDGNTVYVGNNTGLYVYDHMRKRCHRVESVGNVFVTALALSPNHDRLFIGTPSGLLQMSLKSNVVSQLRSGLPVVKAICTTATGNIFVGTDDGLFVSEGNEPFEKLFHRVTDPRSLPGNSVWSLFVDKSGNLWSGTGNGLAFLPASQSVETILLSDITGKEEGNQLYCLLSDKHGRLWMGGTHGLMKTVGFGQSDQSCVWYEMDNKAYPIPHNRIRVIYEDPSEGVLVGSDGGLLRFDESSGQFERIRIEGDPNQWVYDIRPLQDGLLRLVTFDGVYDVKSSQIRGLSVLPVKTYKKELLSSSNQRTLVGREEWSVVSGGIQIRSEDGRLHQIELQDVVLSLFYNQKTNKILAGGVDQLMLVDPSVRNNALSSKSPVVTHLSVNGTEEVTVPSDSRLSLTYLQNNLLVSFSDFRYNRESVSRYAFFVEGLQKEWVSLKSGQNELTLTHLPYGDYTLYLADSNSLPESVEGLKPVLYISIAPPWYRSLWAYMLYLLLAMLLAVGVWSFVRQRVRLKAERRRRDLMLARAKQKLERLATDNDALQKMLHVQKVATVSESDNLSADDHLLLRITNVIEENMDNPELSVNMLSNELNVTGKTLSRKLRQLTGQTSVEFIRSMRMKKASLLLLNRSFSVSEVMYMVGYSNPSYFTRSFVNEYHLTPTEYRNQQLQS